MRSLIRSLADSVKTSRRDVLRILQNGAASISNACKMHRETRTPIANCKMKPNTEPIVQRQPAIHRLRQEIGHVLARRSDRLDPGNYFSQRPELFFVTLTPGTYQFLGA